MNQTQTLPGSRKFHLILREGTAAREMGGEDATVGVRIVDQIFEKALDFSASDIHLQPERGNIRIRLRVDGQMHHLGDIPGDFTSNVLARIKLAAGMHIDEKREPQDGRIDMEYVGRRFSGRVSCLPTLHGEKIVIRLLDPAGVRVDVEQLGMSPTILKDWRRAIEMPYGMIVVTGPTGSGKTSTLYASINHMDRKHRNIVTVEDPIEYEFEDHITQVQVTEKMAFPRVMRSFLRQDPDVMMVGEMRDPESLRIGIQASLTGHLVLTTLHTNNAVETISRMIDMGGEPYLVASTIICFLAQRLVRVICPGCKEEYEPTEDELFAMGLSPEQAKKSTFFHGRGCNACHQSGFRGRIGVFEILTNTHAIKERIARTATSVELYNAARKQGMRTMMEDGIDKVIAGITTPGELVRAVYTAASRDTPMEEVDDVAEGEEPAAEEPATES